MILLENDHNTIDLARAYSPWLLLRRRHEVVRMLQEIGFMSILHRRNPKGEAVEEPVEQPVSQGY
jgi:hypothetical protein